MRKGNRIPNVRFETFLRGGDFHAKGKISHTDRANVLRAALPKNRMLWHGYFGPHSCYTNNRVTVGSGTLYNLLEQFLEADMIIETKVEGRKRSYVLTDKGKAMLDAEYARIVAQAADYRAIFGKEAL